MWEFINGKFELFNEDANMVVVGDPLMTGTEYEMEMCQCPFCGGNFAVDATYLDKVSSVVHCPMCCMEVGIMTP